MKINGNAVRPGMVIEHQDRLWRAVKIQHTQPGKGGAYLQVELKEIRGGSKLNERFRASETVERVRLDQKQHQFLFADGDMYTFMDSETYEQVALSAELIGEGLPMRPPSFCTGCPERPVFTALKLLERETGGTHVSADIGCHALATLPPFNMGNTILGYGLGLASSVAVAPNFDKRVISIMGDGGFWHNGLTTGIGSTVFNKDDSVLVVMKNGYTSATGWQYLPSSARDRRGADPGMSIEAAIRGLGVRWMRKVRTYDIPKMVKTLRRATTTAEKGLKVIVAEGECMLARQRRERPETARKITEGKRVVRTRFGVDDDVCTGDRACVRLSGCPSITIKPSPDPLRTDPVAHVTNDCVGCGVCGEVAHAAVLCPSFYKADIVANPRWLDRKLHTLRRRVISRLQGTTPIVEQTA